MAHQEYSINWNNDPSKEVVLHCDGDLYLITKNHKVWTGPDGDKRRTLIGRGKHTLLYAKGFFGAIHVNVYDEVWKDRTFKAWEQEVYDEAKENLVGFIDKHFKPVHDITILTFEFTKSVRPSYSKYSGKEEYDWTEPVEFQERPHAEQVLARADKILRAMQAQAIIEQSGYPEFSRLFQSSIDSARRKLREVIRFEEVNAHTPKHEIPSWAWEGNYEVCKKRKTKLEKDFAELLGDGDD